MEAPNFSITHFETQVTHLIFHGHKGSTVLVSKIQDGNPFRQPALLASQALSPLVLNLDPPWSWSSPDSRSPDSFCPPGRCCPSMVSSPPSPLLLLGPQLSCPKDQAALAQAPVALLLVFSTSDPVPLGSALMSQPCWFLLP